MSLEYSEYLQRGGGLSKEQISVILQNRPHAFSKRKRGTGEKRWVSYPPGCSECGLDLSPAFRDIDGKRFCNACSLSIKKKNRVMHK